MRGVGQSRHLDAGTAGETGRRLPRPFLGVDFDEGSAAEILARAEATPATRARLVVTANLNHVVTLSENEAFRDAYAGAAARTLDGMWLVWLVRLLARRPAERVTGHDLLAAALDDPSFPDRRVYLICATGEVAASLAARLAARGLPPESLASAVPPHGFIADAAYSLALANAVREHGTTLLILGVGSPRSEIWVHRHASLLGAPLTLAIGEALNVAAGTMRRAPVWMQERGLEWFFRFLTSPRRLFARYFVRSWRIVGIAWRMRAEARSGRQVAEDPGAR